MTRKDTATRLLPTAAAPTTSWLTLKVFAIAAWFTVPPVHTPTSMATYPAISLSLIHILSLPHAVVMIADRAMRERWERFVYCYNFNYASNSFSIAAVTAVAGGSADLWLEELTAYLKENRDHFIRTVSEIGLPITPLKPEAGFLFWIDCSESGIKPEALDRVFLDKAGISLNLSLIHI